MKILAIDSSDQASEKHSRSRAAATEASFGVILRIFISVIQVSPVRRHSIFSAGFCCAIPFCPLSHNGFSQD